MNTKSARPLSIILYSIGLLLALVLWGGSVWTDLEAQLFRSDHGANQVLHDLRCPLVITPKESGAIRLTFHNPTERRIQEAVRAYTTFGARMLVSETSTILPLEPGQTRILEWPISAEDAAWDRMVLFRVIIARSSPLPSRTASCGVMVVNLPWLTGGQVVGLSLGLSLLLMAGGIFLWRRAHQPIFGKQLYALRVMILTALLVLAGFLVAVYGSWLLAGLLFVLVVMFLVAVVSYYLGASTA